MWGDMLLLHSVKGVILVLLDFHSSDDDSDNEEEMLKGHVGACRGDLKMVTQSMRTDPSALEYQDVEGIYTITIFI